MLAVGCCGLAGGAIGWGLGPGAPEALACSNETHCADVSVSGHAEPQPIYRGDKSELKITPKNDGPSPAYGVDLQVDVPHQLEILEVRAHGARSGCNVDGTFVRCDMGDFAPEQLGVVRIEVKGTETGTFISRARVYSQGVEDPNGGNGQVSMTIHVKSRTGGGGGGDGGSGGGGGDGGSGDGDPCAGIDNCADVAVGGRAAPRRIGRGETTELKLTPKNKGPSAAFGIDLQVTIPKGLKVKRVRAHGGRAGCDRERRFVQCDMGDFAGGQHGVVRIKVKAKRRGRLVTEARVYSQGITDPRGGNDRRRIGLRVGSL